MAPGHPCVSTGGGPLYFCHGLLESRADYLTQRHEGKAREAEEREKRETDPVDGGRVPEVVVEDPQVLRDPLRGEGNAEIDARLFATPSLSPHHESGDVTLGNRDVEDLPGGGILTCDLGVEHRGRDAEEERDLEGVELGGQAGAPGLQVRLLAGPATVEAVQPFLGWRFLENAPSLRRGEVAPGRALRPSPRAWASPRRRPGPRVPPRWRGQARARLEAPVRRRLLGSDPGATGACAACRADPAPPWVRWAARPEARRGSPRA